MGRSLIGPHAFRAASQAGQSPREIAHIMLDMGGELRLAAVNPTQPVLSLTRGARQACRRLCHLKFWREKRPFRRGGSKLDDE
jgi:hypothetical protein